MSFASSQNPVLPLARSTQAHPLPTSIVFAPSKATNGAGFLSARISYYPRKVLFYHCLHMHTANAPPGSILNYYDYGRKVSQEIPSNQQNNFCTFAKLISIDLSSCIKLLFNTLFYFATEVHGIFVL